MLAVDEAEARAESVAGATEGKEALAAADEAVASGVGAAQIDAA